MNRMHSGCRGFTLLEVTVALAISGMVLAGASASFLALADQAGRIQRQAEMVDRRGNAERVLRHLAINMRVAEDSLAVRGSSSRVEFSSWCDAPGPSFAPCRVVIRIEPSAYGAVFVLEASEDDGPNSSVPAIEELWRSGPASIRYLLDARWGGAWADSWSEVTAPLALGLISGPDTLVLPLGR